MGTAPIYCPHLFSFFELVFLSGVRVLAAKTLSDDAAAIYKGVVSVTDQIVGGGRDIRHLVRRDFRPLP